MHGRRSSLYKDICVHREGKGEQYCADIIIDITHEKLDKIFQYRIPDKLKEDLRIGMEVVVPFGKGNKETKRLCCQLFREAGV